MTSHNVYILREIGGNRSYVGYTVNLDRRIRQHNSELVGGAKATKGRKWEFMGYIKGFPDNIIALQCEWKLKRMSSKGVLGRLDALKKIFHLETMTSNSIIKNCDLKLELYLREEYLPIELPENIEVKILN